VECLGIPVRPFSGCGATYRIRLPLHTAETGSCSLAVRQQHYFPEHSALSQHLVRSARLLDRNPLRDQTLDLAFLKQVQQFAKSSRNHDGLNRIGHWMLYAPCLFCLLLRSPPKLVYAGLDPV